MVGRWDAHGIGTPFWNPFGLGDSMPSSMAGNKVEKVKRGARGSVGGGVMTVLYYRVYCMGTGEAKAWGGAGRRRRCCGSRRRG